MAYSLEREMFERGLRPRLCYLTKGDRGYGFHLHGERNLGAQFIRKIEPGSPADLAGLRSGDRVVEVNGENVENDTHHQVVQKIMAVEHRARLLVVDQATDELLHFHNLPCSEELAVEMGCLSPRTSSLASSPITSCSSSPHMSLSPSPRDSITLPFFRSSADKPRTPTIATEMDKLAFIVNVNKGPSSGETGGVPIPYPGLAPLPHLQPRLSLPDPEHECQTDLSGPDTRVQSVKGVTRAARGETARGETARGETARGETTRDLRPRLCRIMMGDHGYGFNLHCDKSRAGQFVRSVDTASPAERAGLQTGDRIVEVNDRSIQGMRHSQVVAFIRAGGSQTQLLVVDPETDALFKKLSITPTAAHLKEDCVDGPLIESPVSVYPITDNSASPSPIPEGSPVSLPMVNITLSDPPITNGSLKHQSHGSSSSHSTLSEMSMELSSSDTGNKVFGSDRNKHHSAPSSKQDVKAERTSVLSWESDLRLSPTAAEARQKAKAKRANKRAPPMDWNKKQEIFSNF